MAEKQLIVAVEGTAAMGPCWATVVSDYLDKIIRLQGVSVETSQVGRLSAIPFSGGGFSDAAIAEGLSEALMMFPTVQNGSQNQQNVDCQKHCVLIAASKPHPLPTPVYRPQIQNLEQNENIDAQTENRLYDAEAVAKSFPQSSVSLSVICPIQLPELRAIYNAGKRNPRAADPPIDNAKNPRFLVLISENFMEARATLSRPGITTLPSNQSPVKMDIAPVASVTGPPPTSMPSVNGPVMNRQPISVGNVPPAIVKVVAQNPGLNSFTSGTSNVAGNNNLGMSQPMSNLQGGVSMGQAVPGMSQGNLSGPQMVQSGIGMNPNMMSALGSTGASSGTGTMIPTPGMAQQVQSGMQSLGANNNSASNVPFSQQTSSALASAQSKYVKVWEGNLSGQRQGQPVFITRLEGYRSASASETLAANWPPTMQIVRLISQDHMNNKQYVGKADFLVFRAMNQHGFLGQLQEKKLKYVMLLHVLRADVVRRTISNLTDVKGDMPDGDSAWSFI
ncbi:hypothetical protein C1H46_044094 [Malus baccata]|uniref:Mediator of RNA polymerase II transcription subunit 25 n=1 Tax=Malus baccata TaxID=106549 RepID=A0A540K821_MALBA|nr:hypothetical protein C1H46_044094 [Malus baccata]